MEAINDILFWIFLWLLIWQAYILLFNKGIPDIKTAPVIRKEIIRRLQQDFETRKDHPYTVIDLGAGTGSLTRDIAKSLPEAKVIGLEVDGFSYVLAQFFLKLSGLKNVHYKHLNFEDYDLSAASAVTLYLSTEKTRALTTKFDQELKAKTFIASNSFPLNEPWVPIDQPEFKTLYPHQKTLYLYRK